MHQTSRIYISFKIEEKGSVYFSKQGEYKDNTIEAAIYLPANPSPSFESGSQMHGQTALRPLDLLSLSIVIIVFVFTLILALLRIRHSDLGSSSSIGCHQHFATRSQSSLGRQ